MLWKQEFKLEGLQNLSGDSMATHLGIEFTEVGSDYLIARMPVDKRTRQPYGILHGGASCVLAETLGSVASVLSIDDLERYTAVGVEINANHLRSVPGGHVYGTVKPVRVGRKIHVWNIEIHDDQKRLICVSRITIAVVERRKEQLITIEFIIYL